MNPRYALTNVAFAGGSALSEVFNLENRAILDILMPSAWTAAVLTLQASPDGTRWVDVYDQSGTEFAIQAAADRLIRLDVALPVGMARVRFRSGTAAAPVVQAAGRALAVTSREFA